MNEDIMNNGCSLTLELIQINLKPRRSAATAFSFTYEILHVTQMDAIKKKNNNNKIN